MRREDKLAAKKYNLEEAEQLWRQEPDDNKVFRAATEDIEEYPREIQAVIKEEAKRRHEAKPQRNTIPKQQKKVKFYRILGWILFICGFFGYFVHISKEFQAGKLQETDLLLIGLLAEFIINPLLWAGLILLWRADKNEYPSKKSKWLKVIWVYVILSLTIIIALLAFPIIVRLLR